MSLRLNSVEIMVPKTTAITAKIKMCSICIRHTRGQSFLTDLIQASNQGFWCPAEKDNFS